LADRFLLTRITVSADPIYVPLHPPQFEFDPDELRHAFEQGVKALVLCNPSNPSGKVFTPDELNLIADVAKDSMHLSLRTKSMNISFMHLTGILR
jgi:aspartate/methionine/tyrosine aminotransferase